MVLQIAVEPQLDRYYVVIITTVYEFDDLVSAPGETTNFYRRQYSHEIRASSILPFSG